MKVEVRNDNVDVALRILKKKLQEMVSTLRSENVNVSGQKVRNEDWRRLLVVDVI